MSTTRHFPALAVAIRTAGERLARLPSSPHVVCLRSALSLVEAEVLAWKSIAPPRPEYEKVAKTVLAIHFAVGQVTPRRRR